MSNPILPSKPPNARGLCTGAFAALGTEVDWAREAIGLRAPQEETRVCRALRRRVKWIEGSSRRIQKVLLEEIDIYNHLISSNHILIIYCYLYLIQFIIIGMIWFMHVYAMRSMGELGRKAPQTGFRWKGTLQSARLITHILLVVQVPCFLQQSKGQRDNGQLAGGLWALAGIHV